ncbi:unnamed protein product [Aspergillus oryzae RIB40]|uniref:DNA, SC012 n=2 Tax=Aspergillus oryzae TaxID=5062 RepID=Q2UDP6_ASPOR|nr:unnamed protein product [Aspergillus oryzae RIB40]EIT76161.1 hypothetical protein Ao3042_07793 [Aspergillus oryzae 3.042]KDE76397.1 hypothetical protein AO1008_02121 [Aspergillus oryzae 100-8]BAE60319.1 unnamed protein product [Aspergillus oryzae RIB40]|eukprot:EIT76161.1 hypothetical protein Ao3042_07793 [Aspergillus oryzae 3.042]
MIPRPSTLRSTPSWPPRSSTRSWLPALPTSPRTFTLTSTSPRWMIAPASTTTSDDVETCSNDKRLPTETKVTGSGCYVSISVGNASNKRDANAAVQGEVLNKLGDFLTCLS